MMKDGAQKAQAESERQQARCRLLMSWLDVTKGIPADAYIPSATIYRDWRDTEQRLRYERWIV